MAETPLPAGKTCGNCALLIRCLALGKTDDESRTTCVYAPSRFAETAVVTKLSELREPMFIDTPAGQAAVKAINAGMALEPGTVAPRPPVDEKIAAVREVLLAAERERAAGVTQRDAAPEKHSGPEAAFAAFATVVVAADATGDGTTAPAERKRNKSQLRRERKEAERLAERRAIEEQYGKTLPPTSKPVIGGRYFAVKQPSAIRYGPKVPKGARRG